MKTPLCRAGRRRSVVLPLAGLGLCAALACVEQDDDKPTPDDLAVAKQNVLTTPPAPRFPVNADLDGKFVYLGLDVGSVPIEPGKDVTLTHYWKLVASPGDGWKPFTHLEGPGKYGYINADHAPVKGKYPVAAWKVGDIVRDVHLIRLPATWTSPTVDVYVGMWRSGGGRMPVKSGPQDAEGRVRAASIPVTAAATKALPRKRYVARMVTKAPKVDGKLDDAAWVAAPSTGAFVNTLNGSPVVQQTEAKLVWDKKFLYVGIENADSDVWTTLDKRDDKLWTQEADELMIDADGDGKTYVELQFAPNGNVFDTYLPARRKYEDSIDPTRKPFSWNSKLVAKVHVDGTLNKREDQDRGWTTEVAIPLEDMKGMDDKSALKLPPTPGDVWRINLYRMDVPAGKPQQAAAWAPPMIGDFHALDRFGELVFGDAQGTVPTAPPPGATPPAPADQKATAAAKGGAPASKK